VSAKSRFLGCGSFKEALTLCSLGELNAHLTQFIDGSFVLAFIRQTLAPESVEPEIKAAVDHVSLILDQRYVRYPYNYE